MDEEEVRRPPRPEIGGDLSNLSVRDLDDYLAALAKEMDRVRVELESRRDVHGDAEALFRR